MKKALVGGVIAVGAVLGLREGMRRVHKKCEHCGKSPCECSLR